MPRPRKLTLAAAEAVARQADPEVWDALPLPERRELVNRVNEHHANAWAADTPLRKMFPKAGKR